METSPKIKIIIILIGLILFASLAIFSFKSIQNSGRQSGQIVSMGDIKGVISGQSYDATVPDNLALSNISLTLVSQEDPNVFFQTISLNDGSFSFDKVPSGVSYLLKLDGTKEPVSYYAPYTEKVFLPASQKSLAVFPHLNLNEEAHRDLKRQQGLYLYQSVLELYKKDNSHYLISTGEEKILNTKNNLILALNPYLNKVNFSAEGLIDPSKDRSFVYHSDGTHYWLKVSPERITKISLFDKDAQSYLIQK